MNSEQLTQISHYIDKARQDLLSDSSNGQDKENGALLFMGEMQDPIPRTLIIDQTLNAIDIRVWMLLRISITNPTLPGKLPTQQELSNMINSTKMTIWSSMQILRLNRWITLCDKVRDALGQNRGNIYAIHTEPLAIADSLKLDNDYIDFIEQALNSKVSRVKNNAMAAHIAFYRQINNHEQTFSRTQLQQQEARLAIYQSNSTEKNHSILSQEEQNYYAHNLSQSESMPDYGEISTCDVNLSIVKTTNDTGYKNYTLSESQSIKIMPCKESTEYKNYALSETAQQSHSSQGIKIGAGNSSSSSSSSSSKRLSNTTTTTKDQEKTLKDFDRLKELILPSEIPIARGIFLSIAEPVRQDVLDQLLGRLVNYKKTGQGQIYNLVGFLQTLRARAETGEFAMDSNGLMIQSGRKAVYARKKATEDSKHSVPVPDKTINLDDRQKSLNALNALKKKMNVNQRVLNKKLNL